MLIRMRISVTMLGEAVPEWISRAKGCAMIINSDDVVKVATGTLIEMTSLAELLKDEGIVCRVVGDDLTAGLGSTMPGSVELWVSAADANRANKIRFIRQVRTRPGGSRKCVARRIPGRGSRRLGVGAS